MTPTDWGLYIIRRVIEWFSPLLCVAGLGVCVRAYWVSRKFGYLMIAVCFLLIFGSHFILPAINRAVAIHWPAGPEISLEAQQRYTQELMALNEKYYPAGRVMPLTLKFPLDQIVLVWGLWLLAKHESKTKN